MTVEGLAPGTRYYYRVLVDGIPDRYRLLPFATRTAPAGSGAIPARLRLLRAPRSSTRSSPCSARSRQAEPDVFFWLGDNIYADTASEWVLAEDYRRQRAIASTLPLMRSVPQLAIWDDHDFGLNNSDRTSPVRDASLAVFKNYWANPSYGLADGPGVYFQYAYGGVDFFMLDGRYYRAPNQDAGRTGEIIPGQAPGRVVARGACSRAARRSRCSPAAAAGRSRTGRQGDTWAAFLTERNALFDFIRDNRIEGVFLISGDTHYGEVNAIPWSGRGGYDFYDLVSSPLAQGTGTSFLDGDPELRIRLPYFRTVNFGLLDFAWEPEPRVTFTLRDVRGDRVYEPLSLTPADLRNGASTWRAKMDPKELARRDAAAMPAT